MQTVEKDVPCIYYYTRKRGNHFYQYFMQFYIILMHKFVVSRSFKIRFCSDLSDYRRFELLTLRTIDPSDYWTFRLMSWHAFLHSASWVKMRGDCSFCWYWWNCWPSLFKLSIHKFLFCIFHTSIMFMSSPNIRPYKITVPQICATISIQPYLPLILNISSL